MSAVFSNSKWIFAMESTEKIVDSYFDYKTVFCRNDNAAVTMRISAHTNYAVYLNDKFVDCGQLQDYESRQIYDTLDLTPYAVEGENRLLITQYVMGEDFPTSRAATPGIIFEVCVGDNLILNSSPDILSGHKKKYLPNGEVITRQLAFNFEYDANGAETEFSPSFVVDKPRNFVARPVKKLSIGALQPGELIAQGVFLENDRSLPKSERMQTAYLSACTSKMMICQQGGAVAFAAPEDRRCDGSYLLFDVGETIGFLEFSLEVDEETEILIGFGEHLKDLRLRTNVVGRNYCFRYIAKPGKNHFFHPFRRIGLKYLQLHFSGKSGKVEFIGIRPTRYPMERKPAPVTDGLHRRIWDVASKTLDFCMQDYYNDCILREQAMYPYDGRFMMLSAQYGFHAPEFTRESLRMLTESLRDDGMLEISAPGRDIVNIPCYSAVFIRGVWDYTEYTGDLSLAEEVFPVMQTICKSYAEKMDGNGLLPLYKGKEYWNFYEWQPGMDGKMEDGRTRKIVEETLYEVPLNAYVADGFRCYAWLCEKLQKEEGKEYLRLYDALCKAMHEVFYNGSAGGYVTRLGDAAPRHELTQALMLYVDAVPAEKVRAVEELLMAQTLIRSSLGLSVYAYDALLKNPENHGYVLKDIETRWGWMLAQGCETFWETERGVEDFAGAGATCQGWSALPLYIFGRYGVTGK